jgi:hypothetical protein
MIIIKTTIALLLFGVVVMLWRLIGKRPESILKLFPQIERRINGDNLMDVFSAETAQGKEAEFINQQLPERNKAIKFFRLLLLMLYMVAVVCLIIWK